MIMNDDDYHIIILSLPLAPDDVNQLNYLTPKTTAGKN
jgi:hypothetical protein